MPAKNFFVNTQSSSADIHAMSIPSNDQNEIKHYKSNSESHYEGNNDDHFFAVNSENEIKFIKTELAYSKEDNSEKFACDSKNSVSNQNIFNRNTEFLNKSVDTKKIQDLSIMQTPMEEQVNRKTATILNTFSIKELRLLAAELAKTVKEISSQLVSLLQENDTLRQESDARNIAIEQLLKLAVKQTETELRPVKMSVIVPSNDSDDDNEWE